MSNNNFMWVEGTVIPDSIVTTAGDPLNLEIYNNMKYREEISHPFSPGDIVFHWKYGELIIHEILNRFGDLLVITDETEDWDDFIKINCEELSYEPYDLYAGGLTWIKEKLDDKENVPTHLQDSYRNYTPPNDSDLQDIITRKEIMEFAVKECRMDKSSSLPEIDQQLKYADRLYEWLTKKVNG